MKKREITVEIAVSGYLCEYKECSFCRVHQLTPDRLVWHCRLFDQNLVWGWSLEDGMVVNRCDPCIGNGQVIAEEVR